MIKKLSQKIFLLIMISLLTVILGIIVVFTFFNYTNTINSRIVMMNRFIGIEPKKEVNEKLEPQNKEVLDLNLEGVYNFTIENNRVIQSSKILQNNHIEEYAIKVSEGKSETGIIGDYIFKVIKTKEGKIHVSLMEDKEAVLDIQRIFVFSILLSVLSVVLIYVVAKKVSKIIVKPVEETFEKQKQFISDASHELKTPLAVIEANADVLENDVGENKWIKYIQNEIESMNKLINELLLLAKIENINNVKEYSQIDLSKEVEILVSMFESMAYEKNIKLSTDIRENIRLNGNKEDVEHILSTLIDNAIKHTEAEKEVIIELSKEKNDIIIKVKNQGKQIPEEERLRIFERFYRIDKARNRNEKRYGLGLAIAKSTVEKYKGKIEVLYQEGFTIFNVVIPG